MSGPLAIDRSRTALLAMDCQTGIVSIYAKPEAEFVERAARVVKAARAKLEGKTVDGKVLSDKVRERLS